MMETSKQTSGMQQRSTIDGGPPSPAQLNSLLKEAKSGTEAIDKLYDYYFPKIYNYLYYRLGNQENAEDMTSETFIKIISKFESFSGNVQAFTAWIYRIASNLLTDYYRLAKRKTQVYFMEAKDLAIAAEKNILFDSPQVKLEKKDQIEHIRKAINELAPEEQELISLRFFEGLDNTTIAEILGIKPGTLNVRIHRTVEKLRTILKKQRDFSYAST